MFFEKREYRLRPTRMGAFNEMMETRELPILGAAARHVIGYYQVEAGELNKAVAIWRWESWEERQSTRQAMLERFSKAGLHEELASLVASQANEFWLPTPFFDGQTSRLRTSDAA